MNAYNTIRSYMNKSYNGVATMDEFDAAHAAVDKLELELAAAVAERDEYGRAIGRLSMAAGNPAVLADVDGLAGGLVTLVAHRLKERDTLRARLAAIDTAPTVAWENADSSAVYVDHELAAQCSKAHELIRRPSKEPT